VVNRSEVVAASFDDRFDELFRVAYRAALAIVGVRADAEDCAQESLVRAFGRWSTVEPYANAWVAGVSANLALDRTKRRQRLLPASRPESASELVDERDALVSALRQLPARQSRRYLRTPSSRTARSIVPTTPARCASRSGSENVTSNGAGVVVEISALRSVRGSASRGLRSCAISPSSDRRGVGAACNWRGSPINAICDRSVRASSTRRCRSGF
jgi:hypothetical protein